MFVFYVRAKVADKYKVWTREKAIQLLDKRIHSLLGNVEKWYTGVSDKINPKNKKKLVAGDYLWVKLAEYDGYFANEFGVSQAQKKLSAIKTAVQDLYIYMERNPTMFSVSSQMSNGSDGYARYII